jgi:hypothetical protein
MARTVTRLKHGAICDQGKEAQRLPPREAEKQREKRRLPAVMMVVMMIVVVVMGPGSERGTCKHH